MALVPLPIRCLPGIKRDGTQLEGNFYIDGQWMRFQRGLPRKMGGYRRLTDQATGAVHTMDVHTSAGVTKIHMGSGDKLEQIQITQNNLVTDIYNRTPESEFDTNVNNLWQFSGFYDSTSSYVALIAHVALNLNDISNDVAGKIFIGNIDNTDALVLLTGDDIPDVSGGVVSVFPYLFAYGSNGFLTWSAPNNPNSFAVLDGGGGPNGARVTSSKIVKGLAIRGGGGNSPSALFWALDSVVRATFVGGDQIFQFDTLSDQSSILSSSSPIEYDGIFYWCGIDRFLMFNGVVREIPNQLNLNWFFDNLNYAQQQKVFAFKVPRFGEIWWCFPYGSATECTHAVVFNIREQTWYDTILPNGGRSAGQFAQVYRYPIMIGSQAADGGGYKLWQHETGVDEFDGQYTNAVPSFFETADVSAVAPPEGGQSSNKALRVGYVEPDFVQTGAMKMNISGRRNARAPMVTGPDYFFDPDTQLLYPKEERRELRFRFESNTAGGDYQMGIPLAHIEPGTGTILGSR